MPLSLGEPYGRVELHVKQAPDRGVGGLLWQSSVVLAESLSGIIRSYIDPVERGSEEVSASSMEGSGDSVVCKSKDSGSMGVEMGMNEAELVVIELGAGVAPMPSLAAATCLPKTSTIIATDTPDIVMLTQSTVDELMQQISGVYEGAAVQVKAFDWSDSHQSCVSGTLCNNSQNLPLADIILGADVLYAERTFEDLITSIDNLLKPNGLLVLTYAERIRDSEQHFFSILEQRTGIVCEAALDPCIREGQTVHTMTGKRSKFRKAEAIVQSSEIGVNDTTSHVHESSISVHDKSQDNESEKIGIYL